MRVLKFGGTSVGDPAAIRRVVRIVGRRGGEPLVLVFSAVGDTTDRLEEIGALAAAGRRVEARRTVDRLRRAHLELARQACADADLRAGLLDLWSPLWARLGELAATAVAPDGLPPPLRARLLGLGELLSTHLLVAALRTAGVPAAWVDARELVVTDDDHLNADPLMADTTERCRARLLPLLAAGALPVTQGFIARSANGAETTLGRGGSDLTATVIGAAIGADAVEIWTDVDGVMSADPKLVPGARSVPTMSFAEASALALYGARVLHPRTLEPAVGCGIPVTVRNTLRPQVEGTLIQERVPSRGSAVTSIACRPGMTRIDLRWRRRGQSGGFPERLFEVFARHRPPPVMVAFSEVAASVAVAGRLGPSGLLEELAECGSITLTPDQAVVGVVGERLRHDPAVVSRLFAELERTPLGMVSLGGCEHSLGFLIDEAELATVVRRLHRRLVEQAELVPGGLSVPTKTAAMRA